MLYDTYVLRKYVGYRLIVHYNFLFEISFFFLVSDFYVMYICRQLGKKITKNPISLICHLCLT